MLKPCAKAKSLNVKDFAAAGGKFLRITGRHEGMRIHVLQQFLLEIGCSGLAGRHFHEGGHFGQRFPEIHVTRTDVLQTGHVGIGRNNRRLATETPVLGQHGAVFADYRRAAPDEVLRAFAVAAAAVHVDGVEPCGSAADKHAAIVLFTEGFV